MRPFTANGKRETPTGEESPPPPVDTKTPTITSVPHTHLFIDTRMTRLYKVYEESTRQVGKATEVLANKARTSSMHRARAAQTTQFLVLNMPTERGRGREGGLSGKKKLPSSLLYGTRPETPTPWPPYDTAYPRVDLLIVIVSGMVMNAGSAVTTQQYPDKNLSSKPWVNKPPRHHVPFSISHGCM